MTPRPPLGLVPQLPLACACGSRDVVVDGAASVCPTCRALAPVLLGYRRALEAIGRAADRLALRGAR